MKTLDKPRRQCAGEQHGGSEAETYLRQTQFTTQILFYEGDASSRALQFYIEKFSIF
jgi:hypothetical protein